MRRKNPGFTCAKLFWWYNMGSTADYSITPRPMYPADGRKVFDVYVHPLPIRDEIKGDLGVSVPHVLGSAGGDRLGGVDRASALCVDGKVLADPEFLIYLPHLDYGLQRVGPMAANMAEDCRVSTRVAGGSDRLLSGRAVKVVVVSEYGIVAVRRSIL